MILHKPDCALTLDARAENRDPANCTCGGIDTDTLALDVQLVKVSSNSAFIDRHLQFKDGWAWAVRIRLFESEIMLSAGDAGMFCMRLELTAREAAQRTAAAQASASDRAAKNNRKEKSDG